MAKPERLKAFGIWSWIAGHDITLWECHSVPWPPWWPGGISMGKLTCGTTGGNMPPPAWTNEKLCVHGQTACYKWWWRWVIFEVDVWMHADAGMGGGGFLYAERKRGSRLHEDHRAYVTLDQYSYLNKAPLRASSIIGKQWCCIMGIPRRTLNNLFSHPKRAHSTNLCQKSVYKCTKLMRIINFY